MKGSSCKDSNKNGELIITRIELGINFSILNKTFTFSSNTVKNIWPIRKVYFCIVYSWKCSDFDKVTYWFIKLIYHLKTPNYRLIEYQIYAVINNILMTLSSSQRANSDMGQPSNRLNNVWQQWNFMKNGGGDGEIQGVVRPIMNGWVDTSAHYDDFS